MADATFKSLKSARLVLRRFQATDIETFVAYRADPAIARFQSWENFTLDDGRAFHAWLSRQHPDTPGEWFQFAIELAATGAMIGDCAMHAYADNPGEVEIGFTLAPAHHGHGYAMEAVGGLLGYVFVPLAKRNAVAITDVRNSASIAVLERLGFRRDPEPRKAVLFKGKLCDEFRYGLRREEWEGQPLSGR